MGKKYSDLTEEQRKRKKRRDLMHEIRKKIEAVNLMGGKCQVCGYNKCIGALDFHHIDPSTKEHGWSTLRKQSRKTVLGEIKKCILVCANCHREIHYNEYDYKKNLSIDSQLNQFYELND